MAELPVQPPQSDGPEEMPNLPSDQSAADASDAVVTWAPPRSRTLKIISWTIIIGFTLCMVAMLVAVVVALSRRPVSAATPAVPAPPATMTAPH